MIMHDILLVHVLASLDLRVRQKGLSIKESWLELLQYVLTEFVYKITHASYLQSKLLIENSQQTLPMKKLGGCLKETF